MKEEAKLMVGLIKSQCKNIVEFIEIYLIDAIRNDDEIDNIDWIEDMLNARNILREVVHGTQNQYQISD